MLLPESLPLAGLPAPVEWLCVQPKSTSAPNAKARLSTL
jgi:hypothetical protein